MAYFLCAGLLGLVELASAFFPKASVGEVDTPARAAREQFGVFVQALGAGDSGKALGELARLPSELLRQFPGSMLLVLPFAMVLVGVLGGAIARSSVVELALGERQRWEQSLGQSLTHWRAAVGALLGPWLLVAVLAIVLAVLGTTLSVPVLGVVSAALAGLGLVVALIAAGVVLLWLVGLPLLMPAVMAEGAGGLDALQRVFAYVAGRPVRILGYYIVALLQLLLVLAIAAWLIKGGLHVAAGAGGALTGERTDAALSLGLLGQDRAGVPIGAHERRVAGVLAFWRDALLLTAPALVLSYFFTMGGVLYVLVRQMIDQRERHDIWDPRTPHATVPAALRDADEASDGASGEASAGGDEAPTR